MGYVPSKDKEKNAEYFRKWYENNKELHRSRVRENNQRALKASKQYILDYLLANPCTDCGEVDPIVLEFDHCRGVKDADIAKLLRKRRSIAVIQAEIEKCDVVCANCHKRRTAKRAGNWYKAERDRTV